MNDSKSGVLAVGGMILVVVLALVLRGSGAPGAGARDPAPLAAIEQGDDHIDAHALAAEIMAGRPEFALVDVRPAPEYLAFHLPRAVNLSLPQLLGAEGDALFARQPRLVVLYSNGPAHPGQGWLELQHRGRRNVRVLDGGLDAFRATVLTPASLRDAATEEQSKAEAATFALRTAFFRKASASSPLQTWATDPPALTAPTVISGQWLQARLGQVAVVDARERGADYAALHVPGARHLPAASLREKFLDRDMMLMPAPKLAERFAALGIGNDTPVVIYAEDRMQDATLLALAFLRAGHRALAILEGGLLRWAAEQRPLVSDQPPPPAPAIYRAAADADDFTITVDDLAARVGKNDIKVLDVRPPDFFRGDRSTEARPGHIPGAVNRLYTEDLARTEDGHYWRPRAELTKDYEGLGLTAAQPIAVSCRTGHTASESFFVLRYLLGFRDVKWFNGSWTEWAARTELPAELGDGAKQ